MYKLPFPFHYAKAFFVRKFHRKKMFICYHQMHMNLLIDLGHIYLILLLIIDHGYHVSWINHNRLKSFISSNHLDSIQTFMVIPIIVVANTHHGFFRYSLFTGGTSCCSSTPSLSETVLSKLFPQQWLEQDVLVCLIMSFLYWFASLTVEGCVLCCFLCNSSLIL